MIPFPMSLRSTTGIHAFIFLLFTGSSGLTFNIGELPGSLATIGMFVKLTIVLLLLLLLLLL